MGFIQGLLASAGTILKGTNTLVEGKGTTRLREDNGAESWLTQSIRPIIALWILGLVTIIVFDPDTFTPEMSAMIFAMLSDVIKFYFIARSSEKIINMVVTSFLKLKK